MRILFSWILSIAAFAVLGAASVWMGGLNQDEGWYLYAANMVADGFVPYRDFFYTQGPVMPYIYSAFSWVWRNWGILGARVFTLSLGVIGIVFAVALVRRLVPWNRRDAAGLIVFLLLGCNLYHVYYLTIPKTYALSGLFIMIGFYMLSFVAEGHGLVSVVSGFMFALAAGTRVSLVLLPMVAGLWLLMTSQWRSVIGFAIGGAVGLAVTYLPFVVNSAAFNGLLAAQMYHAARGGFDMVWTVGSVSRLVRWYLPVFVALGLWVVAYGSRGMPIFAEFKDRKLPARQFRCMLVIAFLVVFALQISAPFPYEDYQVPVMGILAIASAAGFAEIGWNRSVVLMLGLCFATSFGSPLLEKWNVNGQDRFWSLKKDKTELAQLREIARRIEELDPKGRELMTQDLYLAIETGRKVPRGLEMGPFSMLTDMEWRNLLGFPKGNIAALSGYTFAIEPPSCRERPVDQQMEYWNLLKRNYEFIERHDAFGQNATPLLILKRKGM